MEKFNYYFNTRERINEVLNGPINKATMPSVLFNLAWEVYHNISTDEQNIKNYIEGWMFGKTNDFHMSAYAKMIRSYIKKMKDMPWRDIQDTVKVRKSELEYISSFNDIKIEKLLFCYLAIAKFMDMSRPSPTHWESESDSAVFKMARVVIPAKERDYFIHDMIEGEYKVKIHQAYNNDDMSKRIDYISDDENDPVVLELDESNYHELAFTYLNWKNGGGYKKCKGCGRLFRVKNKAIGKNDTLKKNEQYPTSQYCKECRPTYEKLYKGKDETALDYEPKKIICKDCGEEFYPDSYMASKTCRCNECQKKVAYYVPMKYKKITCADCGKEFFVDSRNNKTYRCEECQEKANYTPITTRAVTCVDCGKEFLVDSRNTKTYRCEECQKKANYTPMGYKTIKCEICGKEFEVDSKNNRTTMCRECYTKYRREKKTEYMRNQRQEK